jgi:hypothetical protein
MSIHILSLKRVIQKEDRAIMLAIQMGGDCEGGWSYKRVKDALARAEANDKAKDHRE